MSLTIVLTRNDQESLQRQIFSQIRDAILGGQLLPGTELPSTRVFSQEHALSRNTVLQAYQWLISEGYLDTQRGGRTFVSLNLPEHSLFAEQTVGRKRPAAMRKIPRKLRPTFKGARPGLPEVGIQRARIDFWPGRPNPKHFPLQALRRLLDERILSASKALCDYGDPSGLLELRTAISRHLQMARGIHADPDQIFITSGIQEGLNIVSRLFIERGTDILIESPCYRSAALVFRSYGARLHAIPVDKDGARTEVLSRTSARIVYVTPSHQFPTGAMLSLERRLQLIEWAQNKGAYIIEDDYDNDFRYFGAPLNALGGLDGGQSVIHLGTFSKSIGAGLRTGFIVAPRALVEPISTIKTLTNYGHPWIEQAVLADFLNSQSYQRHLRRIRRAYNEVRDCLVKELQQAFGNVDLWGSENGMHLMWRLPDNFPDPAEFSRLLRQQDVSIHTFASAGAYDVGPPTIKNGILLGYSSLEIDEIQFAVKAMKKGIAGVETSAGAGKGTKARMFSASSIR